MAPATAVPAVLAALFGICTVILVASLLVEGPTIDRLASFARYLVLLLIALLILWLARPSGRSAHHDPTP